MIHPKCAFKILGSFTTCPFSSFGTLLRHASFAMCVTANAACIEPGLPLPTVFHGSVAGASSIRVGEQVGERAKRTRSMIRVIGNTLTYESVGGGKYITNNESEKFTLSASFDRQSASREQRIIPRASVSAMTSDRQTSYFRHLRMY